MSEGNAAVLDPATFQELSDSIGSPADALSFLGEYLSMLPGRVTRISNALKDCDAAAAMDAVLSLKISSTMAGAADVARTCRLIENLIRSGPLDRAVTEAPHLTRLCQELTVAGPELLKELRARLQNGEFLSQS